ncbi:mannose-6-phosphate isomerase-like [Haliotis cracherodii]|uniref:mannose-6-phosphate isomerase-like n=1 Tax=Haliotis cracherodii TaxID=6455 RepID=UPI0039E8EFCC
MADNPQVFLLKCAVQKYAWGKVGAESEVAQLSQAVDPEFVIEDNTPYAELWMGTHPNAPSRVSIPGKTEEELSDWIKRNPDKLGSKVESYFKGKLPFLFKVLSVRTSLSIQAHPNLVLAEVLHKKNPGAYKDSNHKPEMAIALTPFQGLCGFRPIKEVAKYLEEIDEFREAVGSHCAVRLLTASNSMDMPLHRETMKMCFTGLMNREPEVIKCQLESLVAKVEEMKANGKDTSHLVGDVLLKLHREFPGDRGGFAIYFLNVITLQPGEAMFLEANLPHAYLSGDCMECMACSDNVVRAGLTVKFVDVHTLCEMLNYTGQAASKTKFKGIEDRGGDVAVTVFRPFVTDFAVTRFEVPAGVRKVRLAPLKSASICIVIEGSGEATNATLSSPVPLQRGSVFFFSAEEEVIVNVTSDGMLLFRAYAGV